MLYPGPFEPTNFIGRIQPQLQATLSDIKTTKDYLTPATGHFVRYYVTIRPTTNVFTTIIAKLSFEVFMS